MESQNETANAQLKRQTSETFWGMPLGPGGMFWAVVAYFGPPGTPRKKCSLSRKRPKEDERVGGGHFHERVGESPGQDENFGANAFTKSRFVPEIRPFEEKKFRDKIFPNSKYIILFIELSESYSAGHF